MVVLSVALYGAVKSVNKNLAILALSFRVAESIIGGITALFGFAAVLLIQGSYAAVIDPNEFNALLSLILEIREASYLILYGFMSVGSLIIFYLMYKAKYLPTILSLYGVLTYILMISWTFINILVPEYPAVLEVIFIAPGAIFEITIGFWLLFKGIDESEESSKLIGEEVRI